MTNCKHTSCHIYIPGKSVSGLIRRLNVTLTLKGLRVKRQAKIQMHEDMQDALQVR